MPKDKNISWHWEIEGFKDTFKLLKDAEKFLLKHGEYDINYAITKVTDEHNRRKPNTRQTKYVIKTRVNYVCEICDCIRRRKTVLIYVLSEKIKKLYDKKNIYIKEHQTCKNPACVDFKKYLKKYRKKFLPMGKCLMDGCDRISIKGKNCMFHGGPETKDFDPLPFENFALGKYRTSQYCIFKSLRFLDETHKDWLVDDENQSINTIVESLI